MTPARFAVLVVALVFLWIVSKAQYLRLAGQLQSIEKGSVGEALKGEFKRMWRKVMLARFVRSYLFSGALVFLSLPLGAQQIIHALTGTVSQIDPDRGTITVLQDNHDEATFQRADAKITLSGIDKRIAADATMAAAFDKSGAYTIVFYCGGGDVRNVVALKSLGTGPFTSTEGTVEKYDRGKSIEVRDGSGTTYAFAIDGATVAETNFGAVPAKKFSAGKGDHVRIVSSTVGGTPTVLFVRDL